MYLHAGPRFSPTGASPTLRHLADERGVLWSWVAGPRLYATEVWGYLSLEMAQVIVSHSALPVRAQQMDSFNCWFEMTGYDSAARNLLTQTARANAHPGKLHIGTRSKLVAMGVSVANLVLGGRIQHHGSLADMQAAFDAARRSP